MHVEPVRYFSPRVSATRRVGSSQLDNVNVAGVGARVYRVRFAWDRVRAVKVSEGRRSKGGWSAHNYVDLSNNLAAARGPSRVALSTDLFRLVLRRLISNVD